jgi:branched-chain amino acid transport system permease protein
MLEQVLVNAISAGMVYALIGLGFSLIAESCGFFDLGQGGIYVVGFYLTYALASMPRLSIAAAVVIAILLTGGLGVLIHESVYARLRSRAGSTVALLVASLAVLSLLESATSLLWGPDTRSLRASISDRTIILDEAHITLVQFSTLFAVISVYVVIAFARRLTPWGRQARAIASDRELAAIHGIPVRRATMVTVAIASSITAAAAIISSFDTDMSPAAAFPSVLMAWIATVLGGTGRIVNTLLAGLCLGLVQHVPTLWVSSSWQDPILYGSVLLMLLWRPLGLAAIKTTPLQR